MSHRVLIVDDQKIVSRLLRSAIETIEPGLIVIETPSGEEAILEADRSRIDLFVVDFRLPGITGVELMKKLRVLRPGCKVIMVSGVTDPTLIRQATEVGADAFFPKPVPISDFLEAVEQCLGLAHTARRPQDVEKLVSAEATRKRPGVSSLLVNLRKRLNAEAVLLLDDMGKVVAQAGEMPGPDNNSALFSALVGLLGSAQKAAVLIDHTQRHLHVFGAEGPGGIFLPVGQAHALLMVGNGLADARTLPTRLELLFRYSQVLADALNRMGVPLETTAVTAQQNPDVENLPVTAEDLPDDFLNIFDHVGDRQQDANSFWDSAVQDDATSTEPDKLTYEQASRLGLTPDSASEE